MDEFLSAVYILTDERGNITRCEGGYTTPADLTGWIKIDEGSGDRYNLCQTHYFDGGLETEDGIPLYRWDGYNVVIRTNEDIDRDRAAIPPPPPTAQEETNTVLLDLDYRMTLLENGIKESDLA